MLSLLKSLVLSTEPTLQNLEGSYVDILRKTSKINHGMEQDQIKTIGVIGAGQMGSGIVQVSTEVAKKSVVLMDSDVKRAEKAKENIGMSKRTS